MKKYFIVVFSVLLLSGGLDAKRKKKPLKKSYEQEQKVEKSRVNTMKYPLSKKAQDFEPKSERKYGFEIDLLSWSLLGVMDINKDLELLASLEYYYDYFTKESQLFSLGSGIRYNFGKNQEGSSWYVSPILEAGVANTLNDNYFLIGAHALAGYIWRWENFRLSLGIGPRYNLIFGNIGSKYKPIYGKLSFSLGWSF